MKAIDPKQIADNPIDIIGREWMLVTSGTPEHFNTMTASWGGVGYLWNRPVATIFVRPERYTYGFIERTGRFTLSFLGEGHKAVHKIAGSKSGRDTDKIAEAGLHPVFTETGGILYAETRLGLECEVLYADTIAAECFADPALAAQWYGPVKGEYHKMYIAGITGAWVRE
ncbi:MAG: flavin reductase family protein [Rikenellaceae bacterium]|nr:flavin reductase family protein [Rikenellaceae bacterium]